MRFSNMVAALEWFALHKAGQVTRPDTIDRAFHRYDGGQCAAADLERILDRFPSKAKIFLIEFGISPRQTAKTYQSKQVGFLIGQTLKRFKSALANTGYI